MRRRSGLRQAKVRDYSDLRLLREPEPTTAMESAGRFDRATDDRQEVGERSRSRSPAPPDIREIDSEMFITDALRTGVWG